MCRCSAHSVPPGTAAPRCWAAIVRRKDGGSVAFFMFGRSFNDPDGHIWEIFLMDPSHVQGEWN
jgi:hypothetical protein